MKIAVSGYLPCIQRRIQKWIQSRVFAQPSGNRRCVSGGISSRIFVATVDTGGYIGYTSDTHRIRVSGVSDRYAEILSNTCRIQTEYIQDTDRIHMDTSYSITKTPIFDNNSHFSREVSESRGRADSGHPLGGRESRGRAGPGVCNGRPVSRSTMMDASV